MLHFRKMKRKTRLLAILSTCGLIFTGCSLYTIKPKQTTRVGNQLISFDTLKSRFEKGDKIIINDWVLIGPKDFFDSVSIDKNTVKGIQLPKDSIRSRFGEPGTLTHFYEIKIHSLDSLPQGYFIDPKAYRYLNPNDEIFCFINGSPCEFYSNALYLLTNIKINEIRKLDAMQATAIWGKKYGKNGAIVISTNNEINAQEIFRPFSPTCIARKIVRIDSLEYYSNKVSYKRFDNLSTLKKTNGIIKVITAKSAFEFRDNTNTENPIEYSIEGQNEKNKLILIKGQDVQQDYYYMINQELNKLDTLVGNPMIFGDKLLCQEGSYTDGKEFIEVWNFKNGKLELIKKFSLRSYGIFTDEIYFRENTIFVIYNSNKYLKLKI